MAEFLKCDALGCDHVEQVEAITADMVGKLCPKCGASLLTQGDWEVWSAVFEPAMRHLIEAGLAAPADAETPESERVSYNYHDGELRIGGLRKGQS